MTPRPTRLRRIDPGDVAKIFAIGTFILSLPPAIFALLFGAPGRNVQLNGFFSYKASGSINIAMIMGYPFINALFAMIAGFICAWLYNALARRFGGVRVVVD